MGREPIIQSEGNPRWNSKIRNIFTSQHKSTNHPLEWEFKFTNQHSDSETFPRSWVTQKAITQCCHRPCQGRSLRMCYCGLVDIWRHLQTHTKWGRRVKWRGLAALDGTAGTVSGHKRGLHCPFYSITILLMCYERRPLQHWPRPVTC